MNYFFVSYGYTTSDSSQLKVGNTYITTEEKYLHISSVEEVIKNEFRKKDTQKRILTGLQIIAKEQVNEKEFLLNNPQKK